MMMFVANLPETFEILKRLNGVYILIFHLTQARFRGLIKKKFENCCKKTAPKKRQRTGEIAETEVWIEFSILAIWEIGWFEIIYLINYENTCSLEWKIKDSWTYSQNFMSKFQH